MRRRKKEKKDAGDDPEATEDDLSYDVSYDASDRSQRSTRSTKGGGSGRGEAGGGLRGPLRKKGAWGTTWKTQWFVCDNGMLMEYSKPKARKPKTVVPLSSCRIKLAEGLTGQKNSFGIFYLTGKKGPIFLQASNEEQRIQWVTAIARFCKIKKVDWETAGSMVDAVLDPCILASNQAVILDCNDAALTLFGYGDKGELVGKQVTVLMPTSIARHHDSYVSRYHETGEKRLIGQPRQVNALHKEGHTFSVMLSLGEQTTATGEVVFMGMFKAAERGTLGGQAAAQRAIQLVVTESFTAAQEQCAKGLEKHMLSLYSELHALRAKMRRMQHQAGAAGVELSEGSQALDTLTDTDRGDPKEDEIIIDSSEIVLREKVGSGASGTNVYVATVDGWQCACKELPLDQATAKDVDSFEAEMYLLESLPVHKNLVRFLFHTRDDNTMRVFMQFYSEVLTSWLVMRRKKKPIERSDVARMCLDVVRGLEVLHENSVIHRDLKSDNIFVTYDTAHNVSHLTLGDFDSAKKVVGQHNAKTMVGTSGWMAPEVYESADGITGYTSQVDVWSFGIVMYELMTRDRPWKDVPVHAIAGKIADGEMPEFDDIVSTEDMYGPLLPLFQDCLARDPSARPSLAEIRTRLSDCM